MRYAAAWCAALAVLSVASRAWAWDPPEGDDLAPEVRAERDRPPEGSFEDSLGAHNMRTRAESVSFDATNRRLELVGNVRVDLPPFHVRSSSITLSRTRYGLEIEGHGTLAFCPCLGTPVRVEFDKAIVAPPGELLLKSPTLRIYDVPVAWLPWFWLRSDEKVGLLPPDIAYRGQDGMYAGGGVHLPWKDRDARQALDLRGGGYLEGGFVADARLRSPNASTHVRWDRLDHAGLLVDARGASNPDATTTVAWDADLVRGRRGVTATSDLDAAAKPWDRAAATGSVRLGPILAETGVRAVLRRGGELTAIDAAGPFVALRTSGALGTVLVYDATVEGGGLRTSGSAAAAGARSPDEVSYTRAEIGAAAATTLGPLSVSLHARGAGDAALEGERSGSDRAGKARLQIGMPLVRAFRGDAADPLVGNDPVIHVVEPFVSTSILHTDGDAILGTLPGRGMAAIRGTAPIADAGVTSTIGRWGRREALEIAVAGGGAYDTSGDRVLPAARAHVSAGVGWFGAQVESGHVADRGLGGSAAVARLRVGPADGPHALANAAARGGSIDPVLARALTDATLESPATFLARTGTTGGAGLVVPWGRVVTTSVAADYDASARELVALRGGLELRDRCKCVTLRANGSHRIGRDGVDVWIALDFAADR